MGAGAEFITILQSCPLYMTTPNAHAVFMT
jgi:hypothetical protein